MARRPVSAGTHCLWQHGRYSIAHPTLICPYNKKSIYLSELVIPVEAAPLLIMVIISTGSCQQEREKKL